MTDRWTEHDRMLEGALHGWLSQERPLPSDRNTQIDSVLGRIHEAPGTRRRFFGWLHREAEARRRPGTRGPTIQLQPGRYRLMYSATGLMALAAVLALAASTITTDNPSPASGGASLSVAADGSGEYTTIGAALEEAGNGDIIVVAPGTYQEALLIDRNVTIRGDGSREEVVVTGYDDPDMWPQNGDHICGYGSSGHPGCSVLISGSSPKLQDLTFRGDFAGVWTYGGAPVIERVTFDDIGREWQSTEPKSGEPLVVDEGSRLTLRDSVFSGGRGAWLRSGSDAHVEANSFFGGAGLSIDEAGPGTIVRGNHLSGRGIDIWGVTSALIEGNTIEGAPSSAIDVGDVQFAGPARGTAPVIRDNVLLDSGRQGIIVGSQAAPLIEGNLVVGSPIGVQIGQSSAVVRDNEIADVSTGIVVVSGGDPTISGNTVDADGRGIVAGAKTSPVIEDNTVCGGDVSIYVNDEASPELGQNQTCEVAVTG